MHIRYFWESKKLLIDIKDHFVDGVSVIPILGNWKPNNRLEKLAIWLHPYTITANNFADAVIIQLFAYFKNWLQSPSFQKHFLLLL